MKSLARKIFARSPVARAMRWNVEMVPPVLMGQSRRANRVWSQYGEDERLVRELADSLKDGYYVDVGANHPAYGSNTYRLYNLGMRGVCVEPNEELCALHRRYRPADVIVCAAVGPEPGLAKFYELSYHGVSTFSEADAKARQETGATLRGVTLKPLLPLSTILAQAVPEGRSKLELLSVDAEGWDEIVLRSNDWETHRPRFVLVEANTEDAASSTRAMLEDVGYARIDTFGVNGLFHDTRRG